MASAGTVYDKFLAFERILTIIGHVIGNVDYLLLNIFATTIFLYFSMFNV